MATNLKFKDQNRHSTASLVLVMGVTAITTAILLLVFILPVYFGADPLGWGAKLGIIGKPVLNTTAGLASNPPSLVQPAMSETNQANAVALATDTNQADDPLSTRQETVQLTIPPKQSLDYRLKMERDFELDYAWKTDGKPLYAELRGEPEKAKNDESKTFGKPLLGNAGKGFFIIPFDGQFGWHWQNKTDKEVKIRLTTKGHYQVVGQLSNLMLN